MADDSPWRHTDQGRPYYVDSEGRYIYVGETPTSPYGGSSPHFDDTLPAVTGQNYQSYDQGPCSWPGTALPGYEHQKLSGHNVPHFGDGSQQSAYPQVDHPADDHDVYRDAKSEWGRAGPPDSEYDQEYYQYKGAEPVANDAADAYTTYKRDATRYPGQFVKDNSDTLGGRPLGTQDWHAHAADLADDAAQACQTVAQLRSDYNADYLAYHQPDYLKGHKEARDNYERRATTLSGHAEDHRDWQSLEDRIAEGRARKGGNSS